MSLANLGCIRQRTGFVMRLGCCLLCISLLLGLACPLQAHAVVAETVIALCAAYLACVGFNLAAHDMNASGTSNALAKMITDFLDTELGGVSISQWAEAWYSTEVMIQGGVVYLPGPAANALVTFAQWAIDKYGDTPGGDTPGSETVVFSDYSFTAVDGKQYALTTYGNLIVPPGLPIAYTPDFQAGTTLLVPSYDFSDEIIIPVTSDVSVIFYKSDDHIRWKFSNRSFSYSELVYLGDKDTVSAPSDVSNISFTINTSGYLVVGCVNHGGRFSVGESDYGFLYKFSFGIPVSDLNITGGSLTIGVLQGLTLPRDLVDGETLKLNLGNPAIYTPESLTDSVIGGIQAGDLTAEAEIVDAVDVPIDPPVEPTAPDIDGLGLPALGAALVSRFPFSIPWDVAKGVQLLSAPPKAPYWEVDLLAPISYRVGGWKGDTTWVIDMSEFEIIGQLSRWTSTIGFCLLLASGTKRLIWTA